MQAFKSLVALLATVAILAGAGALIAVLLYDIDADEETWKRYVLLLTGVESILFASVGWLFGKEVHREQAHNAEQKRDEAEEKRQVAAERAAGEAEKGRGLARAILSAADTAPDQRDVLARAGMASVDADRIKQASTSSLSALAAHAKRAYQDL